MGVEALTRVFEYAPHDGMELLVLISLANIADPAGVCWPGHEYLALYARIKHDRNLRQYLRALEGTGNLYSSKIAHRNQKAMYLVATAMSDDEIEQVLTHSFELPLEDARSIAADMVERQRQAEAEFPLPLNELRKNKRKGGGPRRGIGRSAKERRIDRSAKERRIDRSGNESGISRSPSEKPETRINRSTKEREIGGSSFGTNGGSADPKRRIVRSRKADQRINAAGQFAPSERAGSRPDPIMIQHDPIHDPPPPAQKTSNLGGGGGPSETILYLQETTNINAQVTEEFADIPLDRVKTLVEQKRRAGSQDGGIVIALRALQERLSREALVETQSLEEAQAGTTARVETLEARARAIAPDASDELDLQWLMVYLEEGAREDEALRMLNDRRARRR